MVAHSFNARKWKDFNKEKPPSFTLLIVQRERNDEVVCAYYQSCKEWGHKNRFSIEKGGNLFFDDVKYWMLMPPPKK